MLYHEFPLHPVLSEYVQSIWAMESEGDEDTYPKSQILPDGIVEIVFHYGDPFYTYQGNEKFLQPRGFAISMMRKYVEIESSGRTGFISIRCYPWGAYHFFDVSIRNFLDQTLDAGKLWGDHASDIIMELNVVNTIEERFERVRQFMLKRLKEYRKDEHAVDNAVKLIRSSKGQLTIEEICEKSGLSKKQLERKFLATVGTTPKIFSRSTRFLSICNHLEELNGKTLTQLTHECGYYDQAHFIREFKEFSGFTPKEFFKKENVYFSEI